MATAETKQALRNQPRHVIDDFTADLKARGYDSVILPYRDGAEVVVFDPGNVRSTTAMFDPAHDGENGLRLNIRDSDLGLSQRWFEQARPLTTRSSTAGFCPMLSIPKKGKPKKQSRRRERRDARAAATPMPVASRWNGMIE